MIKISKILNKNRGISVLFYALFRVWHLIKDVIIVKKEFKLTGDLMPKLYVPFHPIPESNLYGHITVLRKYLNSYKGLIELHIQHGVILGNLVQKIMIDSFGKVIVTYSESRKKIIQRETNKKVVAVGPYIRYAEGRLSEDELRKQKEKYGKTLLVFPAHASVDRAKISFNQLDLVKKIKDVKAKFEIETVFINLFYTDLVEDTIHFYEQNGFTVCSAGYWLSENFLPNLRTIIELSDLTMSNKMGTHVGYCLALNKPHYIYKQDYRMEYIGMRGEEDKKQTVENESLTKLDTDRIEQVFFEEKFEITKEQLKIADEFWGNNIFYTSDELKRLVSN